MSSEKHVRGPGRRAFTRVEVPAPARHRPQLAHGSLPRLWAKTVYFEARNPFGYVRSRDRDRYDGSIADGVLLRSEIAKRRIEPGYVLGLRGRC